MKENDNLLTLVGDSGQWQQLQNYTMEVTKILDGWLEALIVQRTMTSQQ